MKEKVVGIHTYNFNLRIEVIDIISERISFFGIIHSFLKKVYNIFAKGKK
jgi:hypothetical protein